jgi:hypothetical protein
MIAALRCSDQFVKIGRAWLFAEQRLCDRKTSEAFPALKCHSVLQPGWLNDAVSIEVEHRNRGISTVL